MSGVKQITTEGRTKPSEKNSRNRDTIRLIDENEDDFTLEEASDEFIPRVINKAKHTELNLEKQYKRRVNHCTGRKIFRIHDFTKPGDHGEKDRSLVYVEFQGGMFEAIKQNMVRILKAKYQVVKTSLIGHNIIRLINLI